MTGHTVKESRGSTACRAWMLLYAEGGLWSAEEVKERAPTDRYMASCLAQLEAGGFVVRVGRRVAGQRVRFKVTGACRIPRGVTLDEIVAVGIGGRVPHSGEEA